MNIILILEIISPCDTKILFHFVYKIMIHSIYKITYSGIMTSLIFVPCKMIFWKSLISTLMSKHITCMKSSHTRWWVLWFKNLTTRGQVCTNWRCLKKLSSREQVFVVQKLADCCAICRQAKISFCVHKMSSQTITHAMMTVIVSPKL